MFKTIKQEINPSYPLRIVRYLWHVGIKMNTRSGTYKYPKLRLRDLLYEESFRRLIVDIKRVDQGNRTTVISLV